MYLAQVAGVPTKTFRIPEHISEGHAQYWLTLFNQPQNCRKLFNTWKPILEALDRLYNTNVRQLVIFMQSMTELISTCLPMFEGNGQLSREPIAYCMFVSLQMLTKPFSRCNTVFVLIADPVHGCMLQMKAVRPLTAGDQVNIHDMSSRSRQLQ